MGCKATVPTPHQDPQRPARNMSSTQSIQASPSKPSRDVRHRVVATKKGVKDDAVQRGAVLVPGTPPSWSDTATVRHSSRSSARAESTFGRRKEASVSTYAVRYAGPSCRMNHPDRYCTCACDAARQRPCSQLFQSLHTINRGKLHVEAGMRRLAPQPRQRKRSPTCDDACARARVPR